MTEGPLDDESSLPSPDPGENKDVNSLYLLYIERLHKYQTLIMALSIATIAYGMQQLKDKTIDTSAVILVFSCICCSISILNGLQWIKGSLKIAKTEIEIKAQAPKDVWSGNVSMIPPAILTHELYKDAARLKRKRAGNFQYFLFLTGVILLGISQIIDLWNKSQSSLNKPNIHVTIEGEIGLS